MRITDNLLFQKSVQRLNTARSKYAQAMEVAQTGYRVRNPSDDPRVRKMENTVATSEATIRATNVVLTRAQGADSSLQDVNDILTRVREIAVQAATGTVPSDARTAMAQEVSLLRKQVIQLANTNVGGSYVFGGMNDGSPPFDTTTGAFSGSTNVRQVQVAPGMYISDGVSGADVFGTTSGVNMFDALEDLETAMTSSDLAAIQGSIGSLDTTIDQVLKQRVTLGGLMNQIDAVQAAAERAKEQAVTTTASLVEADPFEAYAALAQAETALNAAVQVASQLPMPGLINK